MVGIHLEPSRDLRHRRVARQALLDDPGLLINIEAATARMAFLGTLSRRPNGRPWESATYRQPI
jgi:hypothetical protein